LADQAEPALDLIEPTGVGWREVQVIARTFKKGLSRLTDMELGFMVGVNTYG